MADFHRADLRGSRLERVNLTGAHLHAVDLSEARFSGVGLHRVVMRGVELVDVDIRGEIENLTINGVDVVPLIDAELNRRYPDRAKMRPVDPAGFRAAWDAVELLWGGTVERAGRLRPELLGLARVSQLPGARCLLIVLNEEWEHRLYAERDLDILQARDGSAGPSDTTT
jgi:uncharacterized protein YjbI with pentapeptide repeats